MISDKQFDNLLDSLRSINEKMDILIVLQKQALPKQSVGKEENKVLQFCDRKHTIEDIVKDSGKTENNVKVILTHLKDKALIRSKKVNDTIVYEKI